jgi:ABC-type multidrug transport system fused ATPase/permease subunit
MRDVFGIIFNFEKKLKIKFLFLFVLIVLLGIANMISVFSIAPVVDTLLEKNPSEISLFTKIAADILNIEEFNVFSSLLFFVLAITLTAIGSIIVQYYILNIKYASVTDLIGKSFTQFYKSKYSFFSETDKGRLLNTFQKESEKIAIVIQDVTRFVSYFIQLLLYLFIPFYISTSMSLIFIFTAVIFCAPVFLLNRKVHPMGVKETSTFNAVSKNIQESFSAAKLILSYGRQDTTVQKYLNFYKNYTQVTTPLQLIIFTINVMIIPLGTSAAMVAIYWGYQSGINLSEVTMILFTFFRMLPLVGQLSQSRSQIIAFSPAIEQLNELNAEAKIYEESSGGKIFKDFAKEITLKNISYKYPNGKEVIKNVTLNFPKNKSIAIVGSSGSGKTTIMDILLGLYYPTSGTIEVDGSLLSNFDINSYRNKLGYVPQEPFLFDDTVRNNMLWSKPDATEDEIWEALEIANAKDVVLALKNGLDTKTGDRGASLSGGQRQRIALARTIIKKPLILLLDEATSSLDNESERYIQKSINNISKNTTMITIAHRLSTIKSADYIYVLESGEILEHGTSDELMSNGDSKFYQMISK